MEVERTFAFVDLAGFTALTEAHGDREAIATVKAFRERTERVLASGDELVKSIGDALMLAFPTPHAAVGALTRLFEQELRGGAALLLPRAGAHHGTAVADDGDYFGQAVNLAARVAAQASGGQLLVTGAVALAARDLDHVIVHVGAVPLRGMADPVDLYDVEVDAGDTTAIDPVCAMRVPTAGAHALSLAWAGRHLWFCGLPCVARFAADPDAYLPADQPGAGIGTEP
jgi:class 3 adenylate cyclase/YHS domain-containing protein